MVRDETIRLRHFLKKTLRDGKVHQGQEVKQDEEVWTSVEGKLTMVWAMNIRYFDDIRLSSIMFQYACCFHGISMAATDAIVAPAAHLSDGYMDLLFTKRCGKVT